MMVFRKSPDFLQSKSNLRCYNGIIPREERMIKMKKGFALIGMLLAMLAAVPSLAQTTSIAMDGRVYTFTGGDGTYTADGMTFVIGEDEVTVIREDGSELCLTIARTLDDCVVTVSIPGADDVTVTAYDLEIATVCEEESVVSSAVYDITATAEQGMAVALSTGTSSGVTHMEQTATSERAFTTKELKAFFEPYAAFGLRYDAELDLLLYQDKQVRTLVDIRKSNGEAPGSGKFSGELTQLVYDGGEVDVTAVRDYEHPDAEGNGKLLGLNVEKVK